MFIGPCAAKKLEASRRSIRSDIDFVLTFEEVAGMFAAKEVDFNAVEVDEREVKVANAQGLDECVKLLRMAKAGKYDGYLLEGMACPGGCVAGAGTINNPDKSAMEVLKSKKESCFEGAVDTPFIDRLSTLENMYNEFDKMKEI